jgi:anti-repressor protein
VRDLHKFLEIGRVFGVGITKRIEGIEYFKDQRFASREGLSVPNSESSKSRAQKTKEYPFSIDMAKELSMLERNAKGNAALFHLVGEPRGRLCNSTLLRSL